MKKLLIIAICLFSMSPFVKAQMFNVNYQMSIPFGEVKDFTDKTSFRGFDMGYHYFLSDCFSVGGALGWNTFYEEEKDVAGYFNFNKNDDVYAITGHQYRYINTVPMLAIGRYYMTGNDGSIRPFVGLGLGTQWTEKRLDVGLYSSTISRWQFSVNPEIGACIPINEQFAANVGVRYNYATKAANGRIPEFQSLTFNIGIILMR